MNSMILYSRAKINLTLDVIKKREDNYHDIVTIMQTINLKDVVLIRKKSDGITIKSNISTLPVDDKNIAYRACKLFIDHFGVNGGASIYLKKSIPVGAGLAGGSSNAAAVLVGMNKVYDVNASNNELIKIGKKLGADVPFCIIRNTSLAEGIGDEITPMPDMPKCYILLIKPLKSLLTSHVYNSFNVSKITRRPNTEIMIEELRNNNIEGIGKNLSNVLEDIVFELVPETKDIKQKVLETGSIGALVSGSGPTVYGLYSDKKKANSAFRFFKQNYDYSVFLTMPYTN